MTDQLGKERPMMAESLSRQFTKDVDRLVRGESPTTGPIEPEHETMLQAAELLAQETRPFRRARPGFQAELQARLMAQLPEVTRPWWQRVLSPSPRRPLLALPHGVAGLLAVFALVTVALGTVAFVPGVQAQLWRVIGASAPTGTQRVSETPFPGSTPVTTTNQETGETRTLYQGPLHRTAQEDVSWEEAREAVDFPLGQPLYLPKGAHLSRIELVSVPGTEGQVQDRRVAIIYRVGESDLLLEQRRAPSVRLGTPPGATTVSVKGVPGWTVTDENTILVWATERVSYSMNGYLPLEEMLRIAESVAPQDGLMSP